MKEFKVGDWVRSTKYLHMAPCKVESIFESNERKGDFGLKSRGTVHYASEAELWQPKEWEWCWFRDNRGEAALKQFSQMCPIVVTNYISKQGLTSGTVEPFIGKLPTFLKDK